MNARIFTRVTTNLITPFTTPVITRLATPFITRFFKRFFAGGAWLLAAACLAVLGSAALATVEVVPIVQFGDLSPDGDGSFGSFLEFGPPCINDSSMVLFSADLFGNSGGTATDELLVRGKPGGIRVIMAREGSLIPDSTGRYDNLKTPNRRYVLNNEGRAAFVCEMTETPGGSSDNQAIFSTDGPGTETGHVRIGDLAPGTTGLFNGLAPPTINNEMPCIIAFYAWAGGYGGAHPGTVYTNRAGHSTMIAKITDLVPGSPGRLWQFDEGEPPSIESDDNLVAFRAQLTGTPLGSRDDAAIYVGRGAGLIEIARGDDPVPGGGVDLDEPYFPVLNLLDNVGFRSVLYPTSAGDVIEIAGGDPDPDVAAISNELLPDSISRIDHLGNPSLSAGNVAAFRATLKETPGGGSDDEGIYRGDGTILVEVAREGQTVPEGGGEFAAFGHIVAINLNAQVLFMATLRNTPLGLADNKALYLWDEVHGMKKLIRTHDTIPSSGGVVWDILALSDIDFGGFRSLNDAGEAVAILDMDGVMAKDGVYLFRGGASSDAAEQLETAPLRLVAAPNPWEGGPMSIRLAGGAGNLVSAGNPNLGGRMPAIEVFNVSGRLVRRWMVGEESAAGRGLAAGTSLAWDGIDDAGRPVGAGLYFIRAGSGAEMRSIRVVRLVR